MKNILYTLFVSCLFSVHAFGQGALFIPANGSMYISGTGTLTLSNAKLTNNGVFASGTDGTLLFAGNAANANASLNGTGTTTLQNLVVNKSANHAQLNQDITVNGNLNLLSGGFELNNGDVSLGNDAMLLNETEANRVFGAGGELIRTILLNAPGSINPSNLGLEITSSANLGLTIIRRGQSAYVLASGNSILRYFNIIPANNNGLDAIFRMFYFDSELNSNNENNIFLWKSTNNGTDWTLQSGTFSRNTTQNWVQLAGINDFSLWTAANNCADLSEISTPEVSITNSVCQAGCGLGGGVITAPANFSCPNGASLQYQVNNGTWSSTLPIYEQSGPAQTVKTRCSCDADNTVVSPASNGVTTVPGPTCNTVTPAIAVVENSGLIANDAVTCAGASVNLTASGGDSYAWSTGATTASITVTPASTSTYSVTVTSIEFGCTATSTRTITVNPLPTPAIAVTETSGTANNDGQICAGASATLTASGGTSYAWSNGVNAAVNTVT
ncbi:MAG: hypothetical protein NW218_14170, partial [Saprospiraceae bacterium]|nr:hypothetical protein [Saprospiraceae bacterium]